MKNNLNLLKRPQTWLTFVKAIGHSQQRNRYQFVSVCVHTRVYIFVCCQRVYICIYKLHTYRYWNKNNHHACNQPRNYRLFSSWDPNHATMKPLGEYHNRVVYRGVKGGALNYSPIMLKCVSHCKFLPVHWENYISISFQIEWDMVVVTVFFSIFNQMEFHVVQNRKKICPHNHIPFDLKGNGNIVFSV